MERSWDTFQLAMRTALNLRACPSLPSMHTLLAFVKEKTPAAGAEMLFNLCV